MVCQYKKVQPEIPRMFYHYTPFNRFSYWRRFHPVVNAPSFFIPEGPNGNEDEVDESPDTQTSQRQNHQDGSPCLLQIKSVSPENPQEKA